MKLNELLNSDILKNAKVISGQASLTKEITSVNIIEAMDIENWGNKNQILLTSFFAFKNSTNEELVEFFKKLEGLETVGIIIKLNRLIKETPELFKRLCIEKDIALIEIGEDIKYEDIVLTIQQPLLNYESYLLKTYYESNRIFSKYIALSESYQGLLNEFKNLTNLDSQLILPNRNMTIKTSNKKVEDYTIINESTIKNDYTQNIYKLTKIHSKDINHEYTLHVCNPENIYYQFDFFIFLNDNFINESFLMITENFINVIKNRLQNDYYKRNEKYITMNNIASSILFKTIDSKRELNLLLEDANLNIFLHFQLLVITYKNYNKDDIRKLRKSIHYSDNNIYYESKNLLVILYNIKNETQGLNDKILKKSVLQFPNCSFYISRVGTASDINKLFKECLDLIKFNEEILNYTIVSYNDIGFFKFLFNMDSFQFKSLISKKLLFLYELEPDLFQTLCYFINNNKNYAKTAELLYLHPKTIRYRIKKIEKMLNINLNNNVDFINISIETLLLRFYKRKDD